MSQPSMYRPLRRRSLMSIDNIRDIVHNIYNNKSSFEIPVNPTESKYIMQPSRICDAHTHTGPSLLLILVKSDAANFAQRMAIRETWGNITYSNVHLVFLVGYYSIVHGMIETEAEIYRDLLQGEFPDLYNNNLNKTVMAYRWAVDNCVNTPYLFFVDEDFFVNVRNIIEYLHVNSVKSMQNLFVGNLMKKAKPFRTKSSKWYITRDEFPYDLFPSYLSGGAILISMRVAKLLKMAFPYVQYIHIDDAYLGLVAKKLNLTLMNDVRFNVEYTSPMHLKDVFASHSYGDHRQLLVVWDIFKETLYLESRNGGVIRSIES